MKWISLNGSMRSQFSGLHNRKGGKDALHASSLPRVFDACVANFVRRCNRNDRPWSSGRCTEGADGQLLRRTIHLLLGMYFISSTIFLRFWCRRRVVGEIHRMLGGLFSMQLQPSTVSRWSHHWKIRGNDSDGKVWWRGFCLWDEVQLRPGKKSWSRTLRKSRDALWKSDQCLGRKQISDGIGHSIRNRI